MGDVGVFLYIRLKFGITAYTSLNFLGKLTLWPALCCFSRHFRKNETSQTGIIKLPEIACAELLALKDNRSDDFKCRVGLYL